MTRKTKSAAAAGSPSRAQRYHDRAIYLRSMARKSTDSAVRAELQRIARELEARAARAEARAAGSSG